MKTSSPFLTDHRLARYVTWGQAMCAWLVAMLFADAPKRHRRRYAMFLFMPRFIESLLVLRASSLVFKRAPARRAQRPRHAPAGFARRTPSRAQVFRAAIGYRLRARLRSRDLCKRFTIWFEALANLDAFTRPLVRRARRRLTRLTPLIAVRPPHDAMRNVASMRAPQPADTS
jgi:hypothetical protein